MTNGVNAAAVAPQQVSRVRWGGQRLPDFSLTVGIVLSFWGLYDSLNPLLLASGILITGISSYLRSKTQFAAVGRPILEEEFVRRPDGSITNYKLRLRLTKVEIVFYVLGKLLIILGVIRSLNLSLIVSGVLVLWATQLYGNWWWFQGNPVGGSDSLALAYEKLRTIGSEVRGAGFVVRRVEEGLLYIEGDHTLTLRTGWAFVEKERLPKPDGTITTGDKLIVSMRRSATVKRKWDPPHHKETIPRATLLQISARLTAALNSTTVFHLHT